MNSNVNINTSNSVNTSNTTNNVVSLGKIINIDGNEVTVKINPEVLGKASLMNIHAVFDDGNKKIVGEILKIAIEYIKISIK